MSCEACHGPGSRHVAWAEVPPMGRPRLDNAGLVMKHLGDRQPRAGRAVRPLPLAAHRARRLRPPPLGAARQPPPRPARRGPLPPGRADPRRGLRVRLVRPEQDVPHGRALHRLPRRPHAEAPPGGQRRLPAVPPASAYDDARHHFHKQEWQGRPSDGALCVSCHMPKSPFMVVHLRADHSIRIPRPDLTQDLGVPNACSQAGCHADKPLSWVGDAYDRWYGMARKPHYGTVLAAGRRADPAAQGRAPAPRRRRALPDDRAGHRAVAPRPLRRRRRHRRLPQRARSTRSRCCGGRRSRRRRSRTRRSAWPAWRRCSPTRSAPSASRPRPRSPGRRPSLPPALPAGRARHRARRLREGDGVLARLLVRRATTSGSSTSG